MLGLTGLMLAAAWFLIMLAVVSIRGRYAITFTVPAVVLCYFASTMLALASHRTLLNHDFLRVYAKVIDFAELSFYASVFVFIAVLLSLAYSFFRQSRGS